MIVPVLALEGEDGATQEDEEEEETEDRKSSDLQLKSKGLVFEKKEAGGGTHVSM